MRQVRSIRLFTSSQVSAPVYAPLIAQDRVADRC